MSSPDFVFGGKPVAVADGDEGIDLERLFDKLEPLKLRDGSWGAVEAVRSTLEDCDLWAVVVLSCGVLVKA